MYRTGICGLMALAATSQACLLPEERGGRVVSRPAGRQAADGTPVGTGDRFNGGSKAPQGLGSRGGNATSFDTLLNAKEMISGLDALVAEYGIESFTTPHETFEGATIKGAKIGGTGGTCNDAYRVFLNGNIHARERGSADNILYFVSDLLYAEREGTGLTYGDAEYTAEQVRTALSAGIVFVPLSNPDGVAYDQENNNCWRKNRNTANGGDGVDLNRNFDFVFDLDAWSPTVKDDVASTQPRSEIYQGAEAFSEAETRSVKWVLDEHSKVRWFVDLHSYAGDVLYSWGSDDNQPDFPYMNFANETYDSVRGDLSDTPGQGGGYGEYRPAEELRDSKEAAQRMGEGLAAGGGREYTIQQSSALYPTAGASDDWAYSRHFSDEAKNLVHAYTVEFGFGNNAASCPFYPSVQQYNDNIKATNAGFMEFLLAAVEIGLGEETSC